MIIGVGRIPLSDSAFRALCVAAEAIVEDNEDLADVMDALIPSEDCEPAAYGLWLDKIGPKEIEGAIALCNDLAIDCESMAKSFTNEPEAPCPPEDARAAAEVAKLGAAILGDMRDEMGNEWAIEAVIDAFPHTIDLRGPRMLGARLALGAETLVIFRHEMPGHAASEAARFAAHAYELCGESEAGNVDIDLTVTSVDLPAGRVWLRGKDAAISTLAYFGDVIAATVAVRS